MIGRCNHRFNYPFAFVEVLVLWCIVGLRLSGDWLSEFMDAHRHACATPVPRARHAISSPAISFWIPRAHNLATPA
jgi:hypothetical protein